MDDFDFETQEDEERKQREAELNAATLAGAKLGAQWGAQIAVSQVAAALEPYAPAVVELARQKALNEAARQIPQLKEFVGSESYNEVLSTRHKLKEAIANAETYPEYQKDLPELYNIAYTIAASQQASTPSQSPGQPVTQTRPAMANPPDLSKGNRRRLIEDFEAKYGDDVDIDLGDPTLGRIGGR